jgi:hypothetical protein
VRRHASEITASLEQVIFIAIIQALITEFAHS